MKNAIFTGCATALCTPFFERENLAKEYNNVFEKKVQNDEGKKNMGVNFDEFARFIEYQLSNKIDALVVCGTTGEASTMTEDEKKQTIKFVVEKVNGRVPVIAGTGGNNTISVVNMTKYAESVGADAALIVTPYYNKTTQKGLIEHYRRIAENTNLPIILYNVPSRTGVNIEPETCLELSKIENIVAIKEASGNISQVAKIAALCGENLHIYSGNDDQIVPMLSLGGKGVISVLSNIMPEYTHNITQNFFDGNVVEAAKMQLECGEIIKYLFCEVNPIPVKEGLNIMKFEFGVPRLPLVRMTEGNRKKLVECMRHFKVV